MKRMLKHASAIAIATGILAGGAYAQDMPERIGYIVNYATHEWYQNVIKGMQDRASELGIEVEVIDANLDIAKQVAAAEDFMARDMDVIIMTPVNEEGVVPILRRAKAEDMPVVLEGNPVQGMRVMVAICDYDTGYHAGVAAGELLKEGGHDAPRVMNVGLPLLSATILRSNGFMDGIQTIYPEAEMVHDLDGGGNPDRAQEVSSAALAADSDVDVIYGINDSSALGGLQAWRAAGLPEDDLLVVGTGSEGLAFLNAMNAGGPFQIEAAMFPEAIGFTSIDTAVALYQGEDVPEHVVSPTAAVTLDTVGDFYEYDGESRQIQWEAVNALEIPAQCMKYASDL